MPVPIKHRCIICGATTAQRIDHGVEVWLYLDRKGPGGFWAGLFCSPGCRAQYVALGIYDQLRHIHGSEYTATRLIQLATQYQDAPL